MVEQPAGPEQIPFDRRSHIFLPSARSEAFMAIRRTDWERLKRRISGVTNPQSRLSILYSILFGVAATALFSVYPMLGAQGLPTWVLPSYVCVGLLLFVFAAVLVWIDRQNRARMQSELSDVMQDLTEIEGSFTLEQ